MITLTLLVTGLILFTAQILFESYAQALRREKKETARHFGRVENVYPKFVL